MWMLFMNVFAEILCWSDRFVKRIGNLHAEGRADGLYPVPDRGLKVLFDIMPDCVLLYITMQTRRKPYSHQIHPF